MCVSFNYSCRMTSSTEPHANEAESIPLTVHVRGAPITGDVLQTTSHLPRDPLPPPLLRLISTYSASDDALQEQMRNKIFLASHV